MRNRSFDIRLEVFKNKKVSSNAQVWIRSALNYMIDFRRYLLVFVGSSITFAIARTSQTIFQAYLGACLFVDFLAFILSIADFDYIHCRFYTEVLSNYIPFFLLFSMAERVFQLRFLHFSVRLFQKCSSYDDFTDAISGYPKPRQLLNAPLPHIILIATMQNIVKGKCGFRS